MKIYKEKELKKEWGIILDYSTDFGNPCLCAVDMETGELITYLVEFGKEIKPIKFAEEDLLNGGYDPAEHGNEFDCDGAIIFELGKKPLTCDGKVIFK